MTEHFPGRSGTIPHQLRRSDGLLVGPFGSGICVYDLLTDEVHILGPSAAQVLAAPRTSTDDLVACAESLSDVSADAMAEVKAGIEALVALGVVNRTHRYEPPEPVRGSDRQPAGSSTGALHSVLDHVLAFRCTDQELLGDVDAFIGTAPADRQPTVYFDIEARDGGGVDLDAAELWEFPNRSGFFAQLPGVIHDFASRSHSMIVFHAGAVRTPDRRILLLPGASESGKSTLVGTLVQLGCDYLGEEMIGVRANTLNAVCYPTPVALDPGSRTLLGLATPSHPYTDPRELNPDVHLLGGETGPVSEIVLPVYTQGASLTLQRLEPIDALKALLENATNLARVGDSGFGTLCALAEQVPVTRVVHSDSRALARSLLAGSQDVD